MVPALPPVIAGLASWSEWLDFTPETVRTSPTTPGVYLFRQGRALVYVGRAGERKGRGLRGRLTIYVSGRAPHSGLGNLALGRGLQDPAWLRERLADVEQGVHLTVQDWSRLAVQRSRLEFSWASVGDAAQSIQLERAVLDALRGAPLWNRMR